MVMAGSLFFFSSRRRHPRYPLVTGVQTCALPICFPALRELTPIGFRDEGFRHVGECKRLERLTCMYCRDTTDTATEHIAGLELKYYYAGLTGITDRSLEILGRMSSLEQVDLYECMHVTDAGLVFLARLPNLRQVSLNGSPGLSLARSRMFPGSGREHFTT